MNKVNSKRIIEVVPYNPKWQAMYERESNKIKSIFKDILIKTYHIGSTAIKGIKAKPIIDILVEVNDINEVDKYNEKMNNIGYRAKGENGIPGRRYFEKGFPQHTYHIHVFETGNNDIERHISFRDYLNNHPKEAKEYSLLKEKLSKKYKYDPSSYTKGKSQFIKEIERKASIWKFNKE